MTRFPARSLAGRQAGKLAGPTHERGNRRSLGIRLTLASVIGLGFAAHGLSAEQPATAPANAPAADVDAKRWSDSVWSTARGGDLTRLEDVFTRLPDEVAGGSADRFRDGVEKLAEHRAAADDARIAERDESLGKMREAILEGQRPQALRHAVIAQSHESDYRRAFEDEEVMDLIEWAERQVPEEETARHWLDAQEILFLLRTFYEDTDRVDRFERYQDELEDVNRRVAYLSRYAPRVLHDMRVARAERMGETPPGAFTPAQAVDYRERLEGVGPRMLFAFLTKSAEDHIETAGWRPLIEGGLESLKTFATTDALREIFPNLGDAEAVRTWTKRIEAWEVELKATSDRELSRRTCIRIVEDLLTESAKSVELPDEVVLREFGDGALSRLDTYSDIIWPDELRRFEQQTAGDFVGVGILIRHNDKREVLVVNPLEGTPAYKAGVRPDDIISAVDGKSTAGWSLNDAVDQITGPRRQEVVLSLKREGFDDPIDIAIERDVIKIHSVKGWKKTGIEADGEPIWDWFIDPDDRIAYIRMTQFTNGTRNDLLEAWQAMKLQGGRPSGLVLDLRHNPGGLLTAAVQITNLFVPSGTIVTGEDKDGQQVWGHRALRHHAAFENVPTVVLINKGSASASEILAGALQAHGAALVVGERSFGKGSVQTVHNVAQAGRLKLTTQYYRLPSPDGGRTPGRLVHKRPGATEWGVDPDVDVPMTARQVADAIGVRQRAEARFLAVGDAPETPDAEDGDGDGGDGDEEAVVLSSDIEDLLNAGIDPQLQTALLLLQARAIGDVDADHRHASR